MSFSNIFSRIKLQFPRVRLTLVAVAITSFLVFSFAVAFQVWNAVPIRHLTRDVPAVVNVPPWVGAISSLGMVLWSATAALCFFSAVVTGRSRGFNLLQLFFYWIGTVTAYLLFDDLFQIHEKIPDLLGVPEELFLVIYGTPVLLFFVIFRHLILRTDFLLLILAIGFFGFSLAVDVLPITHLLKYTGLLFLGEESAEYLVEDGAKFIGICFWLAYLAHASAWALQPNPERFTEAK